MYLETRSRSFVGELRRVLCDASEFGSTGPVTMATASGVVLVTYGGAVYAVAPADLFLDSDLLRLDIRQSTLTLDWKGRTEVRYSAAGATDYELVIFASNLAEAPAKAIRLQSPNGVFSVDLSSMPSLLEQARANVKLTSAADAKSMLAEVSDEFTRLVRRPPRGVPVPVYAAVSARGDRKRAVLCHVYLVEIPLEKF